MSSQQFTTLLEVDDETIENLAPVKHEQALTYVHDKLSDKGCPELRGTDLWNRVFKRAFLILVRRSQYKRRRAHLPDVVAGPALVERAAIVADDHCRQWAVDEKTKADPRWPTEPILCQRWGIDVFQLNSARHQAMTSKWEGRYIPRQSKDAMTARVERAAMQDLEDSRDAPIKERPAVVRAAADIIGLTKRKTEIHVGTRNTVNVMLPTGEDFQKRLARVQEVAAKILPPPTEVPVESLGLEVPRTAEEVPRRASDGAEEASPSAP